MKMKLATAALALAIGLGSMGAAQAEMTKAEVEKIVQDYIMNNAEVILQSVNDYQTKGVAEAQQQALQANARKIFENDMTPVAGNPDGDVRVVEFFDYNCGYCKRVVGDVNKLIENDDQVKLILIDYPILDPTSETAARWAMAADKQGKYLEFHNALLTKNERISDELLEATAKDLKLDVDQLKKDAASEEISVYLEGNRALAQSLNINGTPAFIVEDEIFPGAISYDSMKQAVDSKRD